MKWKKEIGNTIKALFTLATEISGNERRCWYLLGTRIAILKIYIYMGTNQPLRLGRKVVSTCKCQGEMKQGVLLLCYQHVHPQTVWNNWMRFQQWTL